MSGERNPMKRPEVRALMSLLRKGNNGRAGMPHSEETKRKISEAHKGKVKPWAGKFLTEEGRRKIRECQLGEKAHSWKGGITPVHEKIRNSLEYKAWRKSIFERDDYTCQWCSFRGGYIEAHHIKPFAHYPELRFELDNGTTLCRDCHNKTKYGRATKEL